MDFKSRRLLIGMVHVAALPGTPKNNQPIGHIIDAAIEEAKIYQQAGFDGIMIENMHDVPYKKRNVGPEIVASMTAIASALRVSLGDYPIGIQILAGANKEALAVAHAASLDFIRAEGFVFAHVADEGIIEGDAADLLRYRKQIGGEQIKVFTDIKKKHSSHAITSDVSIEDTIHAADFFLSDGIIITGTETGVPCNPLDVRRAAQATDLPIIIGSGIASYNLKDYWTYADAFIIGSAMKVDGVWSNPVSKSEVEDFMEEARRLGHV